MHGGSVGVGVGVGVGLALDVLGTGVGVGLALDVLGSSQETTGGLVGQVPGFNCTISCES